METDGSIASDIPFPLAKSVGVIGGLPHAPRPAKLGDQHMLPAKYT